MDACRLFLRGTVRISSLRSVETVVSAIVISGIVENGVVLLRLPDLIDWLGEVAAAEEANGRSRALIDQLVSMLYRNVTLAEIEARALGDIQ